MLNHESFSAVADSWEGNMLHLAYQSLRSPSFLISVKSLAPRHCFSRLLLTQAATLPFSGPSTAAADVLPPPPPPVGVSERMPAVLSTSCTACLVVNKAEGVNR